jgi:nitrogen regulatory protein P-II 1
MKLIKAYIRQRKIDEVFKALVAEGFCCMTMVEECEGTGHYSDHENQHISNKYPFAAAYKVIKLEILVDHMHTSKVIQLIKENARTGYSGDGIILISPVENVYKVRTEAEGSKAIKL